MRSEYYAVLPFWESPYIPFKGAVPIPEDVAKERIHLQLDYDDRNRVTAAHVKIGMHYKEFEGRFGNLYINAPLTRITYHGNKETHTFFDRFNNQIQVQGNIYTKVYEKDERGRNVKLTFWDEEGNVAVDWYGNATYDWIHEPDGSIIEERRNPEGEITPLRGQFQFLRTRMTFGYDGYFSLLQNIDGQGQLVNAECGASTLRYFYDGQGRFLRWEVYDKNGNKATGPSHTSGEENTFYEYDLQDIIFFDGEGNPAMHWSGCERWHFDIDQFGNRISLIHQDRNGKPMNASRGYAETKMNFSDDGRFLLSQSHFDSDGEHTIHRDYGYHKIEYIRDQSGLILSINYLGTDGTPVERKDSGISTIKNEWDNNQKFIKSTAYDLSGKLIK